MDKHEAGRTGGLATKAKHGADHYRRIGKLGGRPPLTIISRNGTPGNTLEGGKLSAGNYRNLLKLWESHPLNIATTNL